MELQVEALVAAREVAVGAEATVEEMVEQTGTTAKARRDRKIKMKNSIYLMMERSIQTTWEAKTMSQPERKAVKRRMS
jgi:hypothetical protein